QAILPKPPQTLAQNLSQVIIHLTPTLLHHPVHPDRRFLPARANQSLHQPQQPLALAALDPALPLHLKDQPIDLLCQPVPRQSHHHFGVRVEIGAVLRPKGGENPGSDGALVLAEELLQRRFEVGFDEAREDVSGEVFRVGSVGPLERLDGLDCLDAQDAALHERAARTVVMRRRLVDVLAAAEEKSKVFKCAADAILVGVAFYLSRIEIVFEIGFKEHHWIIVTVSHNFDIHYQFIEDYRKQRRACDRWQLPVTFEHRLHKSAVPKMLGKSDGLVAVVEIVTHETSYAPPSVPGPTKLVCVHSFLPKLLSSVSCPSLVTFFEATMAAA
ncbi:alanine:glyoxylate aminotransferase, partial [Striga asiatica]